MSLLQKIKADQLLARKEGFKQTATLLTTLIGEAEMIGKNAGNRESTDQEVQQVIRKFVKNNNETIAVATDLNNGNVINFLIAENSILQSYLPPTLSDAELKSRISGIITESKKFGDVMKELKELSVKDNFEYDAKKVKPLYDELTKV